MAEKTDDKKDEPSTKELMTMIETLAETVNDLTENVGSIGTILQQAADMETTKVAPKVDSKQKVSAQDLEGLSRGDFLSHIIEEVKGALIEPLNTQINSVAENAETTELRRQVNASADAHSDFWDWKEEMGELVKQNPGLTPERLYSLARSEGLDKAKGIDEKIEKEEKEEKAKEESKKTISFGGLKPTSSGGAEQKTDMSKGDAADSAWDSIMGSAKEVGPPPE